ncbi:MAG: hypothetical protein AMXMBFR58_04070 [Phycisphaerae bacterium]
MATGIGDPSSAFKEFNLRNGGVLRTYAFRGSGQNYRRQVGDQWQAINLQKSQWRGGDDPVAFYVNIGLHFPRVEMERLVPPPATHAKLTATNADQTLRVDELFPDDRFNWFEVDRWNLENTWTRFEALLRGRLVPVLDSMATPDGLAAVMRTMPWMVSSVTRKFLGRKLASPVWDPKDEEAGRWKQDKLGRWWGPGEW